MSEIKGQLLGIILVLSIFLTVSVALTAIFTNMTDSVESKVSEVVEFDENSQNTETYNG
ncbi:MAG: hypothetical protein J5511_02490 [Bacilli bacterium]|nr:hypothetical protein [Bacilli bacterium]